MNGNLNQEFVAWRVKVTQSYCGEAFNPIVGVHVKPDYCEFIEACSRKAAPKQTIVSSDVTGHLRSPAVRCSRPVLLQHCGLSHLHGYM